MSNLKPSAQRILRYLQTGRGITTQGARRRFGIYNVSARVSEIRQAGFRVYLDEAPRGTTITRTYRLNTFDSI